MRLHGERLEGLWTLVPAHLDGDEKNWLLLRKRTTASRAGRPEAQVRADARDARRRRRCRAARAGCSRSSGTATAIVARVAGGEAELRTRKDKDYTERFANVAKELAKALKTPDCVLDGEVCALDEEGRPSFSAMQQGKPGTPIVYYVFDVLEVDGEPLVDLPLSERRKRLRKLLDGREPHGPALGGASTTARRCSRRRRSAGLEGIMAQAARLAVPARASARATG